MILPIAVFAAVMFTYNRLLVDSELVVLRAGGCSQFMIARPAIILAIPGNDFLLLFDNLFHPGVLSRVQRPSILPTELFADGAAPGGRF